MHLRLAAGFGLVPTLFLAAPVCQAQGGTFGLAAYKADLANQSDGWWLTSNAAYRDSDGGTTAYAIRYRLLPGGVAATGCLWGVRESRVVGPFWTFLRGWAPAESAAFFYQTSPAGATGFGWQRLTGPSTAEVIQTFTLPDGSTSRQRHDSRAAGDTLHDASFEHRDGQWVSRRSYTWVRQRGGDTPC